MSYARLIRDVLWSRNSFTASDDNVCLSARNLSSSSCVFNSCNKHNMQPLQLVLCFQQLQQTQHATSPARPVFSTAATNTARNLSSSSSCVFNSCNKHNVQPLQQLVLCFQQLQQTQQFLAFCLTGTFFVINISYAELLVVFKKTHGLARVDKDFYRSDRHTSWCPVNLEKKLCCSFQIYR